MSSNEKNLLNFKNLTVDKLLLIFDKKKEIITQLNDRIAELNKSNLTYFECFEYSMIQESKHVLEFALIDFEQIHPNSEIRSKSSELNKELKSFMIDQSMRKDVYNVISHYYKNQYNDEKQNLSQEQNKYVENTMIEFNMFGLGLDDEKKEKVKELNKKISNQSVDFVRNLSENKTEFEFDLEQLEGMDEKWLQNRVIEGTNKYRVKLQYPDFIPIVEYCKNRETRKFMTEAMGSKCNDNNLSIILDTIKLRKEKAELFGFESHSDFKLQNTMAKNSFTVMTFLNKLVEFIKPIVKNEKEKLIQIATEMDGLLNFEMWDKSYYSRIYIEKVSGLNMSDLKKMFSVESVTNGIFSIYQELLGLSFVDITKSNLESIYADDVKLYAVYDEKTLDLLGYFYLDLFPRDGKYSHAAMFSFVKKSKYNSSISAILCNFDPKLNLEFDNVVTYFHEFGHLMHNMVSTNSISALSGTSCQRDFVETPSQMFEEWCYCKEPLKRLVMSEFVESIDSDLIKKINNQNKQLLGIYNAGQLSYGLLDQTIHSSNIPENTWTFYNNLVKELFDWELSPKINMLANWSHMYGYDTNYYGYLWSKVYAIDLFSFFKNNPLDKEMGMRLRNEILSKGGSLDGMEMLRNFMEREPDENSYIKYLEENV